jgi:FMN-dependent NADH-azoreductase
MATILHINSSVRNHGSLSRQLTGEFLAKWQAANPADMVVERDLAAVPVPHLTEQMMGAFFTPADQRSPEQAQTVQLSDTLVDELLSADVIVIGAPMYNFSVSSTLKAWIDHVARAGRTFQYSAAGVVGLATGKRVFIVTATGGVYSEGPSQSFDFLATYLRSVLGFMGMTDVTFIRAEGLAMGDDAVAATLSKSRAALDNLLPA